MGSSTSFRSNNNTNYSNKNIKKNKKKTPSLPFICCPHFPNWMYSENPKHLNDFNFNLPSLRSLLDYNKNKF